MLGSPLPVAARRDARVTKASILFDFWVEISPFSYLRWRYNRLHDRLAARRRK